MTSVQQINWAIPFNKHTPPMESLFTRFDPLDTITTGLPPVH